MRCAQYFVVEQDGKWNIKFGEKIIGAFRARSEALQHAMKVADADGKGGCEALVFLEDADCFKTWKFGDAYYPAGHRAV